MGGATEPQVPWSAKSTLSEGDAVEADDFNASPELSSAVSRRTLLLARKFGAGANREEISRLEILTERLRKLSPRVTSEQIDLQAEMVGMVEGISSKLASIRERLSAA